MSENKRPPVCERLHHADYDTPYLFDLLADAADLIDQQNAALLKADQFMTNGIELGYIRLPTAPDSSLETPSIVREAIAKARE